MRIEKIICDYCGSEKNITDHDVDIHSFVLIQSLHNIHHLCSIPCAQEFVANGFKPKEKDNPQ